VRSNVRVPRKRPQKNYAIKSTRAEGENGCQRSRVRKSTGRFPKSQPGGVASFRGTRYHRSRARARAARRTAIGRRFRAADRPVPRDRARAPVAQTGRRVALWRVSSRRVSRSGRTPPVALVFACVSGPIVRRPARRSIAYARSLVGTHRSRQFCPIDVIERCRVAFRSSRVRALAEYSPNDASLAIFLSVVSRLCEGVRRISQTWSPAARW